MVQENKAHHLPFLPFIEPKFPIKGLPPEIVTVLIIHEKVMLKSNQSYEANSKL